MLEIHTLPTDQCLAAASAKLNDELRAAHGPVLLLLSGGSSLKILDLIDTSLLSEQTTIAMGDDRADNDPSINNFAQMMATDFYTSAVARGCSFIDTRPQPGEPRSATGARFNAALKQQHGSVIIATLGIGPDGHIAGIMPYPEDPETFKNQFEGSAWAVGYDAKEKNQYPLRVTITMPFMRLIDSAVIYAVGDNKLAPLTRACKEHHPLAATPSGIVQEMRQVSLFTDQKI